MHEKDLNILVLFDFYGDSLKAHQKNIIDLYYNHDHSLSEIAEEVGITRQGVRDTLKRGEQTLCALEQQLGLAARFRRAKEQLEQITDALREIPTDQPEKIAAIIDALQALEL